MVHRILLAAGMTGSILLMCSGGISASGLLTLEEAEGVSGGCTCTCQSWNCPYGTATDFKCDGDACWVSVPGGPYPPPYGDCQDTITHEQVYRVLYPKGGTHDDLGRFGCGRRIKCRCDTYEGDWKCHTITEHSGEPGSNPEYQFADYYNLCSED